MKRHELDGFLRQAGTAVARRPAALIFAEDGAELEGTVAHHRRLGFDPVVVFAPPTLPLSDLGPGTLAVTCDVLQDNAVSDTVNAVIAALPAGRWIYYGFNAEYLFYPYCDSRAIAEMLAFHESERRDAVPATVVDLYAPDLSRNPDAVSVEAAHFDAMGYYADPRRDPDNGWAPMDRQADLYGGLRWRFDEHLPYDRRRIDRVPLFRTCAGLTLLPDHRLSIDEMNTLSCPWHRNLTAAICSFRTAKALRHNPDSRAAISSFMWPNARRFEWHPQQLLDLGLMEPGQWF